MGEVEPMTSKYFHNKAILQHFPASGTFELTRKCNFNCKMCYVHSTDTSKDIDLPAERWLEIAREAKEMGMLFLLLTGGEPMIYKQFTYLYKELIKMGFVISINTNLSAVTDEIFELFKAYPPSRLNVSLYGMSEDTYEDLCENRRFTTVRDNILKFKAAGLNIKLNCSFNKHNVHDLDAIYAFANENNLIIKAATYMYPPMRRDGTLGDNQARFTPKEAADYLFKTKLLSYKSESLIKTAEDFLKLLNSDCIEDIEGDKVRCRAGRGSFWITYEGKMMPCGMLETPKADLNQMTVAKAWEYIRVETDKIRMPKKCAACRLKPMCNVCAAMCYTETGAFDKVPSYICTIAEETEKNFIRYMERINGS